MGQDQNKIQVVGNKTTLLMPLSETINLLAETRVGMQLEQRIGIILYLNKEKTIISDWPLNIFLLQVLIV
jgi:hypothetical protein